MDYTKLGLTLKDGRMSKKLKQSQVASSLGVTTATVSSWELGKSKMDIETFVRLCCDYDLDPAAVLYDCIGKTPPSSYAGEFAAKDESEKTLLTNFRKISPDSQAMVLQVAANAEFAERGKNKAVPDMETAQ